MHIRTTSKNFFSELITGNKAMQSSGLTHKCYQGLIWKITFRKKQIQRMFISVIRHWTAYFITGFFYTG